jgi:hypothetical protein
MCTPQTRVTICDTPEESSANRHEDYSHFNCQISTAYTMTASSVSKEEAKAPIA